MLVGILIWLFGVTGGQSFLGKSMRIKHTGRVLRTQHQTYPRIGGQDTELYEKNHLDKKNVEKLEKLFYLNIELLFTTFEQVYCHYPVIRLSK